MSEVIALPEPDNCTRARGLFSGFADGELVAEDSARLDGHLEICAECRAALAGVTEIDRELTAWGRHLDGQNPAPADAREQLAARLESPLTTRQSIPRVPRWVPAAVAALAVAAAITIAVNVKVPQKKPAAANPGQSSFIAIPYLPPLDPRENTAIVRMNIRVATLIEAGYKVTADPDEVVSADVLVGEDGRAHAVHVLSGIDEFE